MKAPILTMAPPGKKRERGRARFRKFLSREGTAFYGFISLWLVGFLLLQVFPMTSALVISFTNFNGMDLASTVFTGFSNYLEALTSPDSRYTMGVTLIYCLLAVPLSMAVALGLALLLNRKIPGRGVYRTAFYLPTMIPIGATALIFKAILDANTGFLNLAISLFRAGTVINWLSNYGLYCLVALAIWGCGTTMVVFLAGLQGIPEELLEAAAIDGAGKWSIFTHIIWPLLSPVTYFQLMLGIIGSLQMFVQSNVMSTTTDATSFWNPMHSMYTYPAYAMNQMMAMQRFGYGVALIWVLFIMVLVVALIVRKTSNYWVYYAIDQEGGGSK